MISLKEIFIILLIHWIADFILQTDKQAKGKAKNWNDLLSHTYQYSLVWYIVGAIFQIYGNGKFFPEWSVTLFVLITFVCHTITDYFTSRLNKKLAPEEFSIHLASSSFGATEFFAFPKGRSYHNLFVSIGFDQILHYIQLFLTYWFLTK